MNSTTHGFNRSEKTHEKKYERQKELHLKACMGGGEKSMTRHKSRGKLTARQRFDLMFDDNSFVELNDLAESQCVDFGLEKRKVTGDGVVIGYSTVDGRTMFAYAQDATVLGGWVSTLHG